MAVRHPSLDFVPTDQGDAVTVDSIAYFITVGIGSIALAGLEGSINEDTALQMGNALLVVLNALGVDTPEGF